MKNTLKRKTIAKGLLCVIWLCIIFYNGTRQGEISQKASKEVIKVASEVMKIPAATIGSPAIKFSDVNYYVRKNAHFFQYFILSIFLCSVVRQFKLYKTSEIFLLLFLLLLFPVLDEFIQKYVPGRTSNVFDIIIDFSGGILAMLIYNIGFKIRKNKVTVKH
ncbi:VanZ family protein [Clostridium tagluense]|uniref:VanZ family protein n=1 Tax=Clostridium tagluense TaxID=360422 RepID=UPI001C0C34ED|nr:VanZ family protein [Clostridium tagluense]MBU3126892.1 VanZ family protein [Clostridium tagluense]MBW9155631.1 VanZ family protein [Clostridium tagluense]MCB2310567.1 VanZ family protein [Clostridium tagluense]MCB2315267.1 VanZ family protein [Clostridium tagluense]MCB2320118.1 VanZ family protein [Clostridium tagluense]